MKILISGNNETGLSQAIGKLFPNQVEFASRRTGYDLCSDKGRDSFADIAPTFDVVIINSALWRFQQTVLLNAVYASCRAPHSAPHIICVGSTTDRVKNGNAWIYNAEKKALRDYCNTLAIGGVWTDGMPKVSYISFGTLSNNQEKHPDRKCLDIDHAAEYLRWVIDSPKHLNINEISIDPMQGDSNYD